MTVPSKPIARLKRKLTVEVLWIYVLAALASEGPTYAYNVRKIIVDRFGFKPSTVTLYTVIYRLEREGLIAKEHGEYYITADGLQVLKQGLCMISSMVAKVSKVAGIDATACG